MSASQVSITLEADESVINTQKLKKLRAQRLLYKQHLTILVRICEGFILRMDTVITDPPSELRGRIFAACLNQLENSTDFAKLGLGRKLRKGKA